MRQQTTDWSAQPPRDLNIARDDGGRITQLTESIMNPQTGGLETRTLDYTCHPSAARLDTVRENGVLIAVYQYDANGNLVTSAVVPTPTPILATTPTPTLGTPTAGTPTPTPTPTNTPTATPSGTPTGSHTATPTGTMPPANVAHGSVIILGSTFQADNCVQANTVQDLDGTLHQYQYTCDAHGALATKTDTLTGATTTYSYDLFGNLRAVTLPTGTSITYQIDAAQRRVGKHEYCQLRRSNRAKKLYRGMYRRTTEWGTKSSGDASVV